MKTNNYTPAQIQAVIEGVSHYFPSFAEGDSQGNVYVNDSWSDLNRTYKWKNRDDFFTTLSEITGVQKLSDIKKAISVLYEFENQTTAPEYPEANTVSTDKLKQFEQEAEAREQAQKQTQENAKRDVEASIKRQQEIYQEQIQRAKAEEAKIAQEKVYVKVDTTEPELTPDQKESIQNLEEAAAANPQKLVEDIETKFEEKITAAKPANITPEEIKVISKQAAVDTVEALITHNPPIIQTAVIKKVAAQSQATTEVKEIADVLTNQKLSQAELSRQIAEFYFGEKVATKILGPSEINQIQVQISNTPKEGFQAFEIKTIPQEHIQNLTQQNVFLGNLTSFGEGEIKSQILSHARVKLEAHIATLPANSLLARTYKSEVVQLSLQSLGIAKSAPLVAAEGSLIGKIAMGSGFGHVASFIQAKTGINLGVKLATQAVAKAVTTSAGAATTGAAAGAAAGSIIPGAGTLIGAIVGFVSTEIIGKIAQKIPWQKVKKYSGYIIGGIAGLIALPFMGVGAALGIGIGTTFLAAGLGAGVGGLTLGSIGAGIFNFFGALTGAFLSAVGMPILVTLLVFPVVVALILFIINSGAYVVPPGSHEGGGGGVTPADCLGDPPAKPVATNIRYSSDGKYAYPVAPFPSSPYGACYHWDGNKAADLFNSSYPRSPIVASENGRIVNVTLNDKIGGKYIILQGTTSGKYYYHAHLCHVFVNSGETVNVGDVIGTMDETGNGRVEHLHYAINQTPLSDTFIGGDGNVCPFEDFEEKFKFGICNPTNYCVNP